MGLLAGLVVLAGEPHGRMVALAGKGHPTPASSRPASPEPCIEDAVLGSSNVLAGKEPAPSRRTGLIPATTLPRPLARQPA